MRAEWENTIIAFLVKYNMCIITEAPSWDQKNWVVLPLMSYLTYGKLLNSSRNSFLICKTRLLMAPERF